MHLTKPAVQMPAYRDLWWPTLAAVRQRGGSAAVPEIEETVAEVMGLTDAQLTVIHGEGPRAEVSYRLAWARTHLKGMGLLTNSVRAIWSLTDAGAEFADRLADLNEPERQGLLSELAAEYERSRRKERGRPSVLDTQVDNDPADDESEVASWKDQLLDVLLSMPPASFERLCQRLLREEGFINARVTGRSGDGGIDGVGVYQLSLVSFPVFFQSKRYRGSVGPAAVRDFRGAMAGRGEKGLLITTGTFTPEARREATRDGAPPVDLIDGDRLCDLLKRNSLGVRTTTRTVEDVEVDKTLLADF